MQSPTPPSTSIAGVEAALEDIVAAHEQKVVSAVAALIEAQMKSKMCLSVQNAFDDNMPQELYYGADENGAYGSLSEILCAILGCEVVCRA